MKTNIDEHIKSEMNKEQELPNSIRFAFDQSYEQIGQQSKKRKKKSWLKPVSAAVATIALTSAILLTNDTALAKLQAFLGLNDPGLETALNNGDVQYVAQSQQSENITITLDHLFVDAYRLGLQINIQSEHIQMDDLHDLTFEHRLIDAQGNEINAHVSDTKPIAGPGIFSNATVQLESVSNNAAILELLLVSNTTAVPSLDGAKLIIETVHFLNKEGGLTSVDGIWSFDLTAATVETKNFMAGNVVTGLELQHAALTNGSMQVSYKIDGLEGDGIFEAALITADGEAFYASSSNVERLYEEKQTIISLVFPYSIWNEQQTLSLAVKGYEKLKLVEKE